MPLHLAKAFNFMEETELIPHLFRTEHRKLVSVLCKLFGIAHVEIAEDIAGDTIGFCENSMEDTVQSIAFFKVPGTPIAYSGVQMSIPSASRSCLRRSATCKGGSSLSRSGLK